jgi:hypothetical protein
MASPPSAPSPCASPIPPPLRLIFKFEREQTPSHANELFTPEPFQEGSNRAYNHYLSHTRTQREDIPQRGSITEYE